MLATILIFMDQQITAVIINRKEYMLKKGGGYHLDLLVLALIIMICSIFGLPWFVAATVMSINHIQSLMKESEGSAPGEKPQSLGVREQRVTNVLVGVAIGLSIFITPILALIPMPVLYGVFLFMGVSALKGLQFFERILLIFIPKKYQPEYVYLKYVPLSRVHLFTFIQMLNMVALWVIKSNPSTSIGFPVMLVVICAIRKFMECIFTKRELRLLDDLLPESDENVRKGQKQKQTTNEEIEIDEEKRKRDKASSKLEKTRNFANEVDLISFEDKTKQKSFTNGSLSGQGMKIQRRRTRHASSDSNSDTTSPIQSKGTTMFVKMPDSNAYFPINVRKKTIRHLLEAIHLKCPSFLPYLVESIYLRRPDGKMLFHLDDDMMAYIENQQIFDIELQAKADDSEKFDMTLSEVKKY